MTGGAQGDDHETARGAYERLGANAAANWAVKVKSAIVAGRARRLGAPHFCGI